MQDVKITRLAELRARALLTQEALAARSGVHRNTISKLETGERGAAHARTVMKLAKALGVEPWELSSASYPPAVEDRHGGDGRVSGTSLVGRLGLRRGTNLPASKATVLEGARLLQEALVGLDEDLDPRVHHAMEFASLLLQGWSDEEAEKEANRRVYELREEEFGGKETGFDG